MIKLQNGSEFDSALSASDAQDKYFFLLDQNDTVVITFTAPSLEYKVTYVKKEHPIDKDGGATAHDDPEIDFTSTETFTFSEETMHTVYLTVASANEGVLPSDGYTISMSVDEG